MTIKVTQTTQRMTIRATGTDAVRVIQKIADLGFAEGLESIVIGLKAVPNRSNFKTHASGAAMADLGSSAAGLEVA